MKVILDSLTSFSEYFSWVFYHLDYIQKGRHVPDLIHVRTYILPVIVGYY